ncbi:MAG: hypothetical protein PHD01_15145 [Geobacteraceae bacterium]|nr:hypothetical protein [Geobacteraceae bacterium]
MENSLCGQQDYLDCSIKTAQYLAGLTTQQDIWSETRQFRCHAAFETVLSLEMLGKDLEIGVAVGVYTSLAEELERLRMALEGFSVHKR